MTVTEGGHASGSGAPPARASAEPAVHLATLSTPLGPMTAGATAEALCLLEFADRPLLPTQVERIRRLMRATVEPGETPVTRLAAEQIAAYFRGALRAFSVPLATPGTAFQEAVWAALLAIGYGETRSYAEQARRIGRPSAVRAVARANGDNRIAIIVPCHRVIGADGSLTGYGGGLRRKRRLLELEQAPARQGELALEAPARRRLSRGPHGTG